MRLCWMVVFVTGAVVVGTFDTPAASAQDEPKGYASGQYKAEKEPAAPGERLTAATSPDLDWVYVGGKGGHHLGKAGKGHLITTSGGIYLATTLKFEGEDPGYWVYKIEGYQEGGKDFYHAYPKAGGGTIFVRHGPAPQPWRQWDGANRGKNKAM